MSEQHRTSPHDTAAQRVLSFEEFSAEYKKGEPERLAKEAAEREASKRRHERYVYESRRNKMKAVLAAVAVFATVKSGGFIDMVADPFSDAGATAERAIPVYPKEIPEFIDGVAFQEYPKKAQKAFIASETERFDAQAAAQQEIVNLFDRADTEGYDGIVAEVNAYKLDNPDLFAGASSIKLAHDSIANAEDNTAAVAELNDFMTKEYGISAGFDGEPFEDRESETKKTLQAYINVFSVLPKDFVAMTKLENVSVSNESHDVTNEFTGEVEAQSAGSYTDHQITMVPNDIVVASASKLLVPFKTKALDTSYEASIAHELGHAIDYEMYVGMTVPQEDMLTEDDSKFVAAAKLGLRNLVARPDVPSTYSRKTNDEYSAELISGLLSDEANGLANVEETRRFGSGANIAMIKMLAQLEQARPGIAKILIANRVSNPS